MTLSITIYQCKNFIKIRTVAFELIANTDTHAVDTRDGGL